MYDIFICDDDEFFCVRIRKLFNSSVPNPADYTFHSYTNISLFLNDIKEIPKIDILFLDIQFPESANLDGYDAAEIFRKYFSNAILVFCSGVYDITPDALFHTPFRYIKKENSDDMISQTISETVNHLEERLPEMNLLVYKGKESISLPINDITYIARNRGYCNVFLSEQARKKYGTDFFVSKQPLPELQDILYPYHFLVPHNSYLVNLKYVWKFNYSVLTLSDTTELNISRSKIKTFKNDITRYSTEKYRMQHL